MSKTKKKILVTGSSGFIGSYLVSRLCDNNYVVGVDILKIDNDKCNEFYQIDICLTEELRKLFVIYDFDYVIHTAAIKSVPFCEENKDCAYKVNYIASKDLCRLTTDFGGRFVFISSDQVFDGSVGNYSETMKTNPINYYGELKELFEKEFLNYNNVTICRTAMNFGAIPENQKNYFNEIKHNNSLLVQGYIIQHVVHKLVNKEYINLPKNEFVNPTSVELLYEQICKILRNNIVGIAHCCGGEKVSRYEFGKRIAKAFQLDEKYVTPNDSNDGLRPKDVSMCFDLSQKVLNLDYWDLEYMIEKVKENYDFVL